MKSPFPILRGGRVIVNLSAEIIVSYPLVHEEVFTSKICIKVYVINKSLGHSSKLIGGLCSSFIFMT